MEILVCDDASTDATRDIVRSYQARDSRVKLLCFAKNKGAGAARNLGMVEARGKYIAFLDSDDEWLPEKLTRQVERMDAEPPEIGVCFCGGTIIKNNKKDHPVAYVPNKNWEHNTFKKFATGQINFLTPTILFRRSCLEKSGLMVPEMRRNEDVEFLLRLFCHYGLAVIPETYVVCHLVVSLKNKHYDALTVALPHHLQNHKMIRSRLGYWPAKLYTCNLQMDLLQAAIRERRWHKICNHFGLRLREFPLLFPKEFIKILKSFLARG
jgi:glycosyltransferase involved in cell wall biosynthesis